MGRVLGLDYGLRRTGLAVTDPLRIIVSGLDTQETPQVMPFLRVYIPGERVDEIVVGYPFLDGGFGDSKFKRELDLFIEGLRKTFPDVPLHLHDERFTSVEAKAIIRQSGHKKRKREDKAFLDQTSAILILQEYLGHI